MRCVLVHLVLNRPPLQQSIVNRRSQQSHHHKAYNPRSPRLILRNLSAPSERSHSPVFLWRSPSFPPPSTPTPPTVETVRAPPLLMMQLSHPQLCRHFVRATYSWPESKSGCTCDALSIDLEAKHPYLSPRITTAMSLKASSSTTFYAICPLVSYLSRTIVVFRHAFIFVAWTPHCST